MHLQSSNKLSVLRHTTVPKIKAVDKHWAFLENQYNSVWLEPVSQQVPKKQPKPFIRQVRHLQKQEICLVKDSF